LNLMGYYWIGIFITGCNHEVHPQGDEISLRSTEEKRRINKTSIVVQINHKTKTCHKREHQIDGKS